MDESWRIAAGSMLPRRHSTEEPRRRRAAALDAEDFRDVFGGPPRTVLLRRFSGELSPFEDSRSAGKTSFYDEVFRPPRAAPRNRELGLGFGQGSGRSLPGFRIPEASKARRGGGKLVGTDEGFYDDIFGSGGVSCSVAGDRRSRSRSKCSSAMSSEDVSPPIRSSLSMMEDGGLSGFASKLRPITIPSRRHYSPPSTISSEDQNSLSNLSINQYPSDSYFLDAKDTKTNKSSDLYRQRSHMGFSCCFSPPETISLEASFRGNYIKPLHSDNSDADSPLSVISSVFLDPKAEKEVEKAVMEIEGVSEAPESSYTIEFDSHDMVSKEGAAAVDEAIAWAKQKFWSHQTSKEVETKDDDQVYSNDSKDIM